MKRKKRIIKKRTIAEIKLSIYISIVFIIWFKYEKLYLKLIFQGKFLQLILLYLTITIFILLLIDIAFYLTSLLFKGLDYKNTNDIKELNENIKFKIKD